MGVCAAFSKLTTQRSSRKRLQKKTTQRCWSGAIQLVGGRLKRSFSSLMRFSQNVVGKMTFRNGLENKRPTWDYRIETIFKQPLIFTMPMRVGSKMPDCRIRRPQMTASEFAGKHGRPCPIRLSRAGRFRRGNATPSYPPDRLRTHADRTLPSHDSGRATRRRDPADSVGRKEPWPFDGSGRNIQ